MSRRKIGLLKSVVYMIGICTLFLCIFLLPTLASDAAEMNPEYAYLKLPTLIGLYLTVIPFYLALYEALKLLKYIRNDQSFSVQAVQCLERIKKYAVGIIFLYGIGMITLLLQNALHPGIALIGFVIMFTTFVITIFAAILQELLQNASKLKHENDLTV